MTVLAGEDFADVRVVIVDNGSGHMRSFSPVSVGPTFFLKNRVRRDIAVTFRQEFGRYPRCAFRIRSKHTMRRRKSADRWWRK